MRWLFSFFISITVQAQSTFDKSMDVSGVQEVHIILHHTFQLEIVNNLENKIIYHSVSEGEYKDDILLKAHQTEKIITIKEGIQPYSERYNDKLSAHKVFAVKVKVEVPSNLKVIVISPVASLKAWGKFSYLFADLNAGDCTLKSFIGNATINTLHGNIVVYTKKAKVMASTRSGETTLENTSGKNQIELKSISGNISVYKTK